MKVESMAQDLLVAKYVAIDLAQDGLFKSIKINAMLLLKTYIFNTQDDLLQIHKKIHIIEVSRTNQFRIT